MIHQHFWETLFLLKILLMEISKTNRKDSRVHDQNVKKLRYKTGRELYAYIKHAYTNTFATDCRDVSGNEAATLL